MDPLQGSQGRTIAAQRELLAELRTAQRAGKAWRYAAAGASAAFSPPSVATGCGALFVATTAGLAEWHMTDGGSGWSPLWSAFLAVLMLGVLRLLYNLWMAPAAAERADTSYLAGAYERALGEQERLKSVVRDLEERARSPLPEISVEHAELGHRWLDDPDEPLLAEGPGERILVERPGSDYCGWWISGFRIVNRGTRSIDLKFTLLAEWPNRAAWKSMDFRDPNWTRWWGVMTNLEPRDDYLQPGTPVHIASDGAYGPITLPFIMLMTLGAWDCVDVFLSITDNVSGKTLPPIRMDSNGSVDV